jgi:hypothetical protein
MDAYIKDIIERAERELRILIQPLGLLGLILSLGVLPKAQAADSFGQASDIYHVGVGARAMAMGSAFTGLADDASAPYYNPAGLAILDEHQLMAMHAPLYMDSNFNYLATAHPFGDKWGALALSIASLSSSKFEVRDNSNFLTSSDGDLRDSTIYASYARKLFPDLSAGANIKVIQQKVVGYSDRTMGLDVGFLWTRTPLLQLGASFANMNTPETKLLNEKDTYRPVSRFGFASTVFKDQLTLTGDLIKVQKEDALYTAGLEYSPVNLISLRTGYNGNGSYTFGMGVNIAPFRIDYAFSDTDLGAFNKVSVTWAWHNIYETDMKPPLKAGRPVYPLSGFENNVAFKAHVPNHVVARWSLAITNAEGEPIRTLEGDLMPPETIEWDARNEVGEPVVEGKYNYNFHVKYKNGKEWKVGGNIDLHLPDHKLEEVIDMNLELNGAHLMEDDGQ